MSKQEPELPHEGWFRVTVGWASWLLMLVSGGLVMFYLLFLLALLVMGGVELLANVLAGREEYDPTFLKIILGALIVGFGPGALMGVHLWSKWMRKTRFISDARIRMMSLY
jgi:hypothetical protein